MLSDKAFALVAYVVLTVWAINFVAALLPIGYESDQAINGIFLAIMGGAVASRAARDKDRR